MNTVFLKAHDLKLQEAISTQPKMSESEFLAQSSTTASPNHNHISLVKPVIVCLCGSIRFKDAFSSAMRNETLAGKIVLTVGIYGHLEELAIDVPTKKMLDELHLRKIDLADEVLILNVGGYIGTSTQRELEYSNAHCKTVRYLEPAQILQDTCNVRSKIQRMNTGDHL